MIQQIVEFPNYFVTKDGRIFSERSQKYLKPGRDLDGYYHVSLCQNGFQKTFKIHRLVAKAFVPNPKDFPQINHKNGLKNDNRAENLEWCTSKMNIQHSWKNGFSKKIIGSKHGRAKMTEEKVRSLIAIYSTKKYTQKELGQIYGVDQSVISDIVSKKTWRHIHSTQGDM